MLIFAIESMFETISEFNRNEILLKVKSRHTLKTVVLPAFLCIYDAGTLDCT